MTKKEEELQRQWAGKKYRDKVGIWWVTVSKFQKRQTAGRWVNAKDLTSWVASLPVATWEVRTMSPTEAIQQFGAGHLCLCRLDEMDEEANEFGPVSP